MKTIISLFLFLSILGAIFSEEERSFTITEQSYISYCDSTSGYRVDIRGEASGFTEEQYEFDIELEYPEFLVMKCKVPDNCWGKECITCTMNTFDAVLKDSKLVLKDKYDFGFFKLIYDDLPDRTIIEDVNCYPYYTRAFIPTGLVDKRCDNMNNILFQIDVERKNENTGNHLSAIYDDYVTFNLTVKLNDKKTNATCKGYYPKEGTTKTYITCTVPETGKLKILERIVNYNPNNEYSNWYIGSYQKTITLKGCGKDDDTSSGKFIKFSFLLALFGILF